ncbi:multidrug effflux MFS transporter [Leucobacter japonicus]|uniref:multidrug effflux MFS transporter n=1 Tax=Leucobacter japonicus TaxID=1461259 RepID=UPI0009E6423D|nr:multidrug effflux MFS transporter [Leucobacter japonicus]
MSTPPAPVPPALHVGSPQRPPALSGGLLLILALLSAVAPFATDLYLPSFLAIGHEFEATPTGVQLTLTAFLLGIAAGQLVFGPLSDRFGRRPLLLIGAAVLVASSLGAVYAPSLGMLIGARLLQGMSGAAGMVLSRAIISDLARGAAVARAMSLMMIVTGVAPVIAPLVGGLFADALGWRGVLAIVLGIAAIMLVAAIFGVRESLTPARRAELAQAKLALGSPLRDLLSRQYLGYTVAFASAFTAMMAYISASPFLYQSLIGVSELQYGLLFGLNALGLMGASAISARWVGRIPPRRLISFGLSGVVVGSVAVVCCAIAPITPWSIAAAVFVVVASLGFVLGNSTALALGAVPRAAGSASALLGALQFGLAALASPLVSIAGERTAVPLGIVMTCAAAIAVIAFLIAQPRHSPVRHA